MHVRQDGLAAGPTVVLLHGFGSSMRWFGDVASELAADHRVIRLDLLGHGRTGGGAQGLDAESQARAVVDALATLDITEACVAGHSFGADVALAVARLWPGVTGLVILGQAPDYSYARFPPGAFLPTTAATLAFLHRLSPWRTALSTMHPGMYRVVLADRRARLAARPLDAQLRDLGIPTLAILGGRDRMYPCAPTAARYRAAGARVAILEDAGHSPHVERPAEVAELIRELLC
ncbi:Pimeloyl-ACP methyl ester carboxylesterase [Amycolatopsis xylanica]|uniref:Pimeloyl-ACP methyl ester carboxylesterase n=1 Tax=Amycolatopsis xylanica TaxID=589385 RepID=A0A1H3CS79_9PSEU|nr:alpha/beta fold hydrolase [Amycolatopsis xylanica]SDX57007.1 Pimeloyl-ACP methyl ester carboxylesterase [Amycolatopsis xylanica]